LILKQADKVKLITDLADFYRSLIFRMGEIPAYKKILMFEQLQRLISDSYYEKRVTPVFVLDEA